VTKVYFHHHNGIDMVIDPDGSDLSLAESAVRALKEARSMMAHEILKGRVDLNQRIDVEDGDGTVLLTLYFHEAVTILGLSTAASSRDIPSIAKAL
jgi:hypothetical protein